MNTLRLGTFSNFEFLTLVNFISFAGISGLLELLSTISSMREEIYEQEVNLDNLLSFSCSRYPSQGTQVMLTQDKETKKV